MFFQRDDHDFENLSYCTFTGFWSLITGVDPLSLNERIKDRGKEALNRWTSIH
jgi:hypothetical protein